jgi:hypothetical protein
MRGRESQPFWEKGKPEDGRMYEAIEPPRKTDCLKQILSLAATGTGFRQISSAKFRSIRFSAAIISFRRTLPPRSDLYLKTLRKDCFLRSLFQLQTLPSFRVKWPILPQEAKKLPGFESKSRDADRIRPSESAGTVGGKAQIRPGRVDRKLASSGADN